MNKKNNCDDFYRKDEALHEMIAHINAIHPNILAELCRIGCIEIKKVPMTQEEMAATGTEQTHLLIARAKEAVSEEDKTFLEALVKVWDDPRFVRSMMSHLPKKTRIKLIEESTDYHLRYWERWVTTYCTNKYEEGKRVSTSQLLIALERACRTKSTKEVQKRVREIRKTTYMRFKRRKAKNENDKN